jgi:hypothetical protein
VSRISYAIPGSPANYWLHDVAHVDNMTVAVGKKNPSLGLVVDTHVCVEGQVVYRRIEADGDIHFKITDPAGNLLTCEIDPQTPLPEPAYQQQIRVYGILRYDLDHDWFEIHPVDNWEDASTAPTPHT